MGTYAMATSGTSESYGGHVSIIPTPGRTEMKYRKWVPCYTVSRGMRRGPCRYRLRICRWRRAVRISIHQSPCTVERGSWGVDGPRRFLLRRFLCFVRVSLPVGRVGHSGRASGEVDGEVAPG